LQVSDILMANVVNQTKGSGLRAEAGAAEGIPAGAVRTTPSAPGGYRTISITQPGRLLFGAGALAQLGDEFGKRGFSRVLVITSTPLLETAECWAAQMRRKGFACLAHDSINAEPTLDDLHRCLRVAHRERPEAVVGIGGGSVLDVSKLAAALADGTQRPEEVFGTDLLQPRRIFLACVPTTAGTGSEASPNSILLDQKARAKRAVISPYLVPDIACLDPRLTLSLPPGLTATTALDALTHCIEAYANCFAHPMVDAWALEGIRLISSSLVDAVSNGNDLLARTHLLLGSYLGGMCLGPVNTAAVHALAYPLGSEYAIAHGLANALLLPHVMRFNLSSAAVRYAAIAEAMGFSAETAPETKALQVIRRIEDIIRRCPMPVRLRDAGVASEALPHLAKSAMAVTRLLKNNPREMSEADALEVYHAAW
jgi:alcohol dehydrogenase